MSIPEAPKTTITRAQVVEACRVLGFDATSLVSVTMRQGAVSVTSFRWDENGNRVLIDAGHGIAKTSTTYPIVEDEREDHQSFVEVEQEPQR